MAWTELAVSDPERAVRWAVRWRQCLGLKQDHAFADTGDALGLTPRYVRGIVRGELRIGARWRLMKHRWWADMDRQAAEFRAAAEKIERQNEAAMLADGQLTLDLGDSGWSPRCAHGSFIGDGGEQ